MGINKPKKLTWDLFIFCSEWRRESSLLKLVPDFRRAHSLPWFQDTVIFTKHMSENQIQNWDPGCVRGQEVWWLANHFPLPLQTLRPRDQSKGPLRGWAP